MEIQSEKEAYERELRNCKTKEDVDRLKVSKINGYLTEVKSVSNNPNIPDGAKLGLIEKILKKVMGIQKVHMEFVESGRYKNLPTEEELAEEAKEKTEQITNTEDTENAEVPDAEDEAESAENPKVPDTEKQPGNTEVSDGKGESEDLFHEAKRELTKYLRDNGSSGCGLEYLIDEPVHKKKIKG